MSKELQTLDTMKGELLLTEFHSPSGKALQLTQGLGILPDGPGFIQLSLPDAAELITLLMEWIKAECKARANALDKEIREMKDLKGTIFEEAVKCERFISEFDIPKLSVMMLTKVVASEEE